MTEQPATPRQVAYAADLRDLLVEQPTRRAEEQIASVVRAIWQGIDQGEQALSAYPSWMVQLIPPNSGHGVLEQVQVAVRAHRDALAAATDEQLTAMDREEISSYIDAARMFR